MSVVVNGREIKPMTEAEAIYRRWVAYLNEQFTQCQNPDRRAEIVRDELHQIYFGRPRAAKMNASLNSEMGISVVAESFDPRNVSLEAEYSPNLDAAKYAPRKPLLWFWSMFDRSPLGLNHWLGVRVRCMLGQHLFKHIGKGVKIHTGVQLTFAYNLVIEDNCRIRSGALLDDSAGELVLPASTIVAPGAPFPPNRTP